MKFGEAVDALKRNSFAFARRAGWNGKGMAIAFMPEKEVAPGDVSPRTARLLELIEEANAGVAGAPPPRGEAPLQVDGYLAMYTARGSWLPGWLASQTDVLAEDWEVHLPRA